MTPSEMFPSDQKFDSLRRAVAERSIEGLRLYRPRPNQEAYHRCDSPGRILRGGVRSGKSTAAAAEMASVLTGIPITTWSGDVIHPKTSGNKPLTCWVIGKGQKHIGQTIYRLLFKPNAFKIIQDLETGDWRAWKPWDASDLARESEIRPAPPLVPSRFLLPKGKSFVWDVVGMRVFSVVTLEHTKNVLYAFTSDGDPKQGDAVDWLWIDEDVEKPDAVPEWISRTAQKGRWIWSAFPHSSNYALTTLSRHAADEAKRDKPDVTEFVLRFSDNPFITAEDRRRLRGTWQAFGSDVLRARDDGEFNFDEKLVYNTFSKSLHCMPRPAGIAKDRIENTLAKNAWNPPPDWTVYACIDPGTAFGAVLFAAVPPPGLEKNADPDTIVLFDEIYQPNSSATMLAKAVKERVAGRKIEAYIIDSQAAQIRGIGYGVSVGQVYADAWKENDLKTRSGATSFIPSVPDVLAGINLVREAMIPRQSGQPRLRFIETKLPNLLREMELYRREVGRNDVVLDKPAGRQRDHLCDCMRYIVSYDPKYVALPHDGSDDPVFLAWKKRKEDRTRKNGNEGESIVLGPVVS